MRLTSVLAALILLISCTGKKTPFSEHSIEQHEQQAVLQELLDLPKWQWVYHEEDASRLPVRLLKKALVPEMVNLTKFGQPVLIQPLEQVAGNGYVEIRRLAIHNDTVDFSMNYPMEGAQAIGQMIKKGTDWIVGNYTVTERK